MAEISPPGITITICLSESTPSHEDRAERQVEIPRDSMSLSTSTRLPCQNPKPETKAALHHFPLSKLCFPDLKLYCIVQVLKSGVLSVWN